MSVELTLDDFGMGPRARKARMRRLGDVIVAEWKSTAKARLGPRTRRPYVRAIGIQRVEENSVTVSLPGPGRESTATLALIIELGMGGGGIGTEGAYDVRQHLLRYSSKNIRWGKNGPYMNVPFNRTTAQIEKMGGREAMIEARALIGSFTGSSRPGPEGSGRLVAGLASKLATHHVADPLQDMIKLVSTYSKGVTQTTGYRLWRRASWNGQAWTSKGVKARRFADVVLGRIPDLVGESL